MLKILNLVLLSDDSDEYCHEKSESESKSKCLKELYRAHEYHSRVNVSTFFLKFAEDVEESHIDDGVIYTNDKECFIPTILRNELHKYDCVLRTNLSTMIDFNLFANELEHFPTTFREGYQTHMIDNVSMAIFEKGKCHGNQVYSIGTSHHIHLPSFIKNGQIDYGNMIKIVTSGKYIFYKNQLDFGEARIQMNALKDIIHNNMWKSIS